MSQRSRPAAVAVIAMMTLARASRPVSAQVPSLTPPVVFPAAADSEIPRDDVGRAIRRGLALVTATRDSLPGYVGNSLRCVSCHPDEGRRQNAMPWVGVYGRFPQYRSRSGSVILIEDRINDCFERSMNGTALPTDGRDMRDIIAYMAFLSRGIPGGATVPGQGLPKLSITRGESAAGAAVFHAKCVRCHGADGQGTPVAPPLWGPESFNIGAGMARVRTAAAFIRYNMPFDRPATLSDQEAFDVATYVTSRPRPDFVGKEFDWPRGDPPPDVAYETLAAKRKVDSLAPKPKHSH